MDELRELVMDLDRYYYYGRHPAFEQQMAKIRKYLSSTALKSPITVTGDVSETPSKPFDFYHW